MGGYEVWGICIFRYPGAYDMRTKKLRGHYIDLVKYILNGIGYY